MVGQPPHAKFNQPRGARLHPEGGTALHGKVVFRELRQEPQRLVAAFVSDQVIKGGPSRRMQRHGHEDDAASARHPGNFGQRSIFVVNVLNDIECADEIKCTIGERQ